MLTITRRCTYGSTRSIVHGEKKKRVQESRGPSYLIAHCQLIYFLAIHFPFHTQPTIPLPSALPATVASRRVALPISQYHSTDLKGGKNKTKAENPAKNHGSKNLDERQYQTPPQPFQHGYGYHHQDPTWWQPEDGSRVRCSCTTSSVPGDR